MAEDQQMAVADDLAEHLGNAVEPHAHTVAGRRR